MTPPPTPPGPRIHSGHYRMNDKYDAEVDAQKDKQRAFTDAHIHKMGADAHYKAQPVAEAQPQPSRS